MIATDQSEQELVLIDDSEKENLPIEEETNLTLLDKDKNKESIERIGKKDFVPAVEEKEIVDNKPDSEEVAFVGQESKLKLRLNIKEK